MKRSAENKFLALNQVHLGDCTQLLKHIEPNSLALSVWSPPYWVGKEYEADLTFQNWKDLLRETISLHYAILKPGSFLAINIADILCFKDEEMPRIQLPNVSKQRSPVTRDMVLAAKAKYPDYNRNQIAEVLGCSEQTVDRRLNGNNIRGGKYQTQTRVKLVGGFIEEWGLSAGLFLYDRRIWAKDPAWVNSQWHSSSYRAVDEVEYVYIFWKPGETVIDRNRIDRDEWAKWGSRGIWNIPSVRSNEQHEAQFPIELPKRLIRLLTEKDDIVLDCFMGSGTSALAAIDTGRNFIGIEKLPQYQLLATNAISRHRVWNCENYLAYAKTFRTQEIDNHTVTRG